MTNATSTRRTVLCAMAAVPVAAIPSIAIASRSPAPAAEWYALKGAHDRAAAASEAFDRDVVEPMLEAWKQAQKGVPHVTTASSFPNIMGGRTHLSTANAGSVTNARRAAEVSADPEYVATCKELVEAHDARAAELARRRLECGYDAVSARSEALCGIELETWDKLMRMPAPDGDALMWKMQEMWGGDEGDGYCDSWSMEFVNVVLADARRLLGVGQA